MERRLAAIMATDVVGYSRLIRADEEGTIAALKTLRTDVIDPKIAEHHGRIVKLMGDGMLAEFASVVDAVRAAVETQRTVAEHNVDLPPDKRIEFRIGVNLGDVVVDGDDIHGDGVNVASRLEGLAEPSGVCVSGAVYDQVRDRIDLVFDDMGEQEVKNIDRPVRVWRWVAGAPAKADGPAKTGGSLPLPDKPSIAVLPFDNMSGDPERDYIADGITEDIITTLSHIHWFFVTARNSSFSYKGRAVDIRQVATELGVRYVLKGSVRTAGDRIRVTAQLIDAKGGNHIWAEQYDRNLSEIFELQEDISNNVAVAIEPSVMAAESERAIQMKPASLDAWSCVAKAWPLIWSMTEKQFGTAEELLAQALVLDPNYAKAHSLTGVVRVNRAWMGWVEPDATHALIAQATNDAKNALEFDRRDPWAYLVLGIVKAISRDTDGALINLRLALEIHSNFIPARIWLGFALTWGGQAEAALQEAEIAMRTSPHDPMNNFVQALTAVAHFFLGNYQRSAKISRQVASLHPNISATYRVLACACAELGDEQGAADAVKEIMRLQPNASIGWALEHIPLSEPQYIEKYVNALRKAGLPE